VRNAVRNPNNEQIPTLQSQEMSTLNRRRKFRKVPEKLSKQLQKAYKD